MVVNWFDLRRIRYLVTIASHGSLSAAGRELNVAQPALSYHLLETERQIGAPLFERSSKGMIPTTIGIVFLQHARLILDSVELAESDVRRQVADPETREPFRLIVIPSLASSLAPAMLAALRREMPEVGLHLIEARTRFAEDQIRSGKADAAVALAASLADGQEALVYETLSLVCQPGAANGPISFAEAAATRLILPAPGNPLRDFVEIAAEKAGLKLNVQIEIDGYEPRLKVVMAGLGTTVIGTNLSSVQIDGQGIIARPIHSPELKRPIVLLARDGLNEITRKTVMRTLRSAMTLN